MLSTIRAKGIDGENARSTWRIRRRREVRL
jgi:hypothetical protein